MSYSQSFDKLDFDNVLQIPLLEKSCQKFNYRSQGIISNLSNKIEKKLQGNVSKQKLEFSLKKKRKQKGVVKTIDKG